MQFAIVVPRYGPDILGGAETAARCFAEEISARGHQVDVLTTCIRSYLTWRNELPEGRTRLNGITVWRFPIAPEWDTPRYHFLSGAASLGRALPLEAQYEWLERSPHSPALYAFIRRRRADYDFFIFIPYLFPTTYYGAMVAPHKSIIWPCLHDEGYAWLHPTRLMLSSARGLMFNAEPERQLARRLGVHHPGEAIVGFGFSETAGDANHFRQTTGIAEPFILYSGRLDVAKNVMQLVRFFINYKQDRVGPLKLVMMGDDPENTPMHQDIIQLGFQQEQAKLDAYAAATVLCQPSINESFSIVIMESWLARVPVLVHGNCDVTHYHAVKSRGGLYFSTYGDFAGAMDWFLENPDLRARMGQNGWRYVTTNYNWDTVARRFEAALARWHSVPNQIESRPADKGTTEDEQSQFAYQHS